MLWPLDDSQAETSSCHGRTSRSLHFAVATRFCQKVVISRLLACNVVVWTLEIVVSAMASR